MIITKKKKTSCAISYFDRAKIHFKVNTCIGSITGGSQN